MKRVLLATRNRKKCDELRAILGDAWQVVSASELPNAPEVEEDAPTFRGNAEKKALALAPLFDGWVLADDSGLEVDALGGEPGVWSARYAGVHGDDAANNAKLLRALNGNGERGAQFHCVVAVARGDEVRFVADGICRGRILTAPAGEGGFGYDPLFVPDRTEAGGLSFAELPSAFKNEVSHRALAMRQVVAWLTAQSGA
jgi:XTP/dITP diphosphohydrolase